MYVLNFGKPAVVACGLLEVVKYSNTPEPVLHNQ